MNLNELQAFLEECNWDDEPMPAQVADSLKTLRQESGDGKVNFEEIELSSDRRTGGAKSHAQTIASDLDSAANLHKNSESETGLFSLARKPEHHSLKTGLLEEQEALSSPKSEQPQQHASPQNVVAPAVTPFVAPTASVEPRSSAAVKLVPRPSVTDEVESTEGLSGQSLRERLAEVEMAQRMGYLLCKCTWPPQIMVLTGTDHVYRCRRCSRVREM